VIVVFMPGPIDRRRLHGKKVKNTTGVDREAVGFAGRNLETFSAD
jgi:hypothetical protein